MPKRKTIVVKDLKERVNRALTDAADLQDELHGVAGAQTFRRGMAVVLEDVLHTTGNYNGFRYTDPKAERNDEGYLIDGTYDETRREYY